MIAQLFQARSAPAFLRTLVILGCLALTLHVAAGADCYTAARYIQVTCADFTTALKQRFAEINSASCSTLMDNISSGQYGRPGPQCTANCTTYFGQDCYNSSDFYRYHAALGGFNASSISAGKRLANIMCMNKPCDS